MTTKEVRLRIPCGNTKLHELFNAGLLRRVKFGGRTLSPEEDVDALIERLLRGEALLPVAGQRAEQSTPAEALPGE